MQTFMTNAQAYIETTRHSISDNLQTALQSISDLSIPILTYCNIFSLKAWDAFVVKANASQIHDLVNNPLFDCTKDFAAIINVTFNLLITLPQQVNEALHSLNKDFSRDIEALEKDLEVYTEGNQMDYRFYM